MLQLNDAQSRPQPHLQLEGTLLDQNNERDAMEFWLDNKKIAFTTKPNGTVSCALDTWEEHSLVGSPFKFATSAAQT